MSRREDIDNAIWSDPDFLALTPEARLAFIWTWTNPRCGMAGLYRVAPSQTALETGLNIETVERSFTELAEARFAFYERGVLFVRARVKRMRQKTEQIAKSIRSDVQNIADDHPLKDAWLRENGGALWLLKHLGSDPQWSLDRLSDDSQGVPALAGNSGGSIEGHPTLKGKGKGKGTGKGPLGRGAGRGTGTSVKPERLRQAEAWAAEHFPTVHSDVVLLAAKHLNEDGFEVNPDTVRARLAETYPGLLGGLAA